MQHGLVHINVLHVEDCPHLRVAQQRIAEALTLAGVSATVTDRLVRTEAEALEAGFRGSPTILVDGADPFPADGASGLSCRLYPTRGGAQGAPTVDQLVEVLTANRSTRSALVTALGVAGAIVCLGAPLLLGFVGSVVGGAEWSAWLLVVAVGVAAGASIAWSRRRHASHR